MRDLTKVQHFFLKNFWLRFFFLPRPVRGSVLRYSVLEGKKNNKKNILPSKLQCKTTKSTIIWCEKHQFSVNRRKNGEENTHFQIKHLSVDMAVNTDQTEHIQYELAKLGNLD